MTKDEALKVEGPLHVVCQCNWCKAHPEQNLSCKSVQARLAAAWGFVKAQPEPWEKFCDSNCVWTDHHPDCKLAQRKPLTDEEIYDMYNEPRSDAEMIAFARAIEAAHGIGGEKNGTR